ncbi:MAG TPA: ATP-binding protein [Casimicrobiaceae bacterium]|nr:ATP-binding protein [Casimicrobiaceae bacterium]
MQNDSRAGALQPAREGADEAKPLLRRRNRPPQPLAVVELALRDSEARYRQLVQSLPIAFYATDAHGRITMFNDAAVALWGRVPVLGEDRWCGSHRMYAPDGAPMALADSPMALAIGENFAAQGAEAIVERPDGVRRNIIVYPQVFRDLQGRPTGAVNALVDITDRKAVESELIASRERLREADQRKDVFLATLAHELRNPLTPIRTAMHVIRLAGDTRVAVTQTRGMIERQLAQLVRLVDDLLDVSRISRGKIELRKERVEVQQVVQQAVETSAALIDHYGHTLDVRMPSEPLHVVADPARLAQVFSNLLNNAAKYTPPPGRITLELRGEPREVEVRVRDNGIGVPSEHLASLFDMFTQVETSLERARGGLGVGLAIVRRLVEMHGGRVSAHSDGRGEGSEFIVAFPRDVDVPLVEAAQAPTLPPLKRQSETLSRRRILVVDDNVDLADSLALMLTMLGHEVHVEHDGAAALKAAAMLAPDLVFLDIGMPKMNGYETCRRMRDGPHGSDAVIVALSGWGQDHDKQRSKEAGMDLHLVKPFDPALLEAMLAKIGGREAAAAQVSTSTGAVSVEIADLTPEPTAQEDAAAPSPEAIVEAARYALFRRVLPVLRHGLVGELQSVQFAVSLAQRTHERAGDETGTSEAIRRIGEQAIAAVGRSQQITDWLKPDPKALSSLGEVVHACLDLVGTEWSLRGIEVASIIVHPDLTVKSAAFREVIAAMLVALGDALPGAADVTLKARRRGDEVVVSLRGRNAARDGDCARVSLYRDLDWSDVVALANAHGVRWSRSGEHVMARFPVD